MLKPVTSRQTKINVFEKKGVKYCRLTGCDIKTCDGCTSTHSDIGQSGEGLTQA